MICTAEIEASLKRYSFTIVKVLVPDWTKTFNAKGEPPAHRKKDKYQYGIGAAAFKAGFMGPDDVKKVSLYISYVYMFIPYVHIICPYDMYI